MNKYNLIKRTSLLLIYILSASQIGTVFANQHSTGAITSPIPINELKSYSSYPPVIKKLIANALSLTQKELAYQYGSSDPKNYGMDCSGTINYLLKQSKVNDTPREASEMFVWTEKNGILHRVSNQDFNSPDFDHLKPGDLLFWSGTYTVHRDPPITHVMLYLGLDVNNKPLMFGASDGRTYHGLRMNGVSVFDFTLPNKASNSKFVGYSCIPDLTCARPK